MSGKRFVTAVALAASLAPLPVGAAPSGCDRPGRLVGPPTPWCSVELAGGWHAFELAWDQGTSGVPRIEIRDEETGDSRLWLTCTLYGGVATHCDVGFTIQFRIDDFSSTGPFTGRFRLSRQAVARLRAAPPECATTCSLPAVAAGSTSMTMRPASAP